MRVSFPRGVACATVIAGLLVGLTVIPVTGQQDPWVATVEQAATLPIGPPRATTETFLDLWIQAYTPPQRGAVEAVVSLARAGGPDALEIGRFAVFPSEPFWATEASHQRAYRFDATAALAALKASDGPLEVRVRLEPIDPKVSPEGAQLTLSKAAFSRRP
jgi:hypothetical protein